MVLAMGWGDLKEQTVSLGRGEVRATVGMSAGVGGTECLSSERLVTIQG